MNNFNFLSLLTIIAIALSSCGKPNLENSKNLNTDADIFPDYRNVTFPVNIASPNFMINNNHKAFYVQIKGDNNSIEILSKKNEISIPLSKWRKFASENSDKAYSIEIFGKNNDGWVKYNTITNNISSAPIDSYVMYRYINPANILWRKMGIYQRNIENFEVEPIMDNGLTDNNCMHCHTVSANNPENFMLHMRGKPGGTVIYHNGELKFVNTKTEHTISAGGYPSWHPNGKLIAFSTNKINQKFHAINEKYAFVYDKVSDIVLYDIEKNMIKAIPKLSQPEFENMPTWGPEGKYLYFLSSKPYDSDTINYKDIKYDLKRISFDVTNNTWGDIELLISSDSIGKSVAFPRVSPNNKYIVCCLADYGYFTVYNETSNIALLKLEDNSISYPEINSNDVESYPSWSKNGEWIMFNSKRADGVSSRPYFSHFSNGELQKPFILPQKTAMWNFEELFNLNRPEFVSSKITLNPKQILKLVEKEPINAEFDLTSLTDGLKNKSRVEKQTDNSFDFDQ